MLTPGRMMYIGVILFTAFFPLKWVVRVWLTLLSLVFLLIHFDDGPEQAANLTSFYGFCLTIALILGLRCAIPIYRDLSDKKYQYRED